MIRVRLQPSRFVREQPGSRSFAEAIMSKYGYVKRPYLGIVPLVFREPDVFAPDAGGESVWHTLNRFHVQIRLELTALHSKEASFFTNQALTMRRLQALLLLQQTAASAGRLGQAPVSGAGQKLPGRDNGFAARGRELAGTAGQSREPAAETLWPGMGVGRMLERQPAADPFRLAGQLGRRNWNAAVLPAYGLIPGIKEYFAPEKRGFAFGPTGENGNLRLIYSRIADTAMVLGKRSAAGGAGLPGVTAFTPLQGRPGMPAARVMPETPGVTGGPGKPAGIPALPAIPSMPGIPTPTIVRSMPEISALPVVQRMQAPLPVPDMPGFKAGQRLLRFPPEPQIRIIRGAQQIGGPLSAPKSTGFPGFPRVYGQPRTSWGPTVRIFSGSRAEPGIAAVDGIQGDSGPVGASAIRGATGTQWDPIMFYAREQAWGQQRPAESTGTGRRPVVQPHAFFSDMLRQTAAVPNNAAPAPDIVGGLPNAMFFRLPAMLLSSVGPIRRAESAELRFIERNFIGRTGGSAREIAIQPVGSNAPWLSGLFGIPAAIVWRNAAKSTLSPLAENAANRFVRQEVSDRSTRIRGPGFRGPESGAAAGPGRGQPPGLPPINMGTDFPTMLQGGAKAVIEQMFNRRRMLPDDALFSDYRLNGRAGQVFMQSANDAFFPRYVPLTDAESGMRLFPENVWRNITDTRREKTRPIFISQSHLPDMAGGGDLLLPSLDSRIIRLWSTIVSGLTAFLPSDLRAVRQARSGGFQTAAARAWGGMMPVFMNRNVRSNTFGGYASERRMIGPYDAPGSRLSGFPALQLATRAGTAANTAIIAALAINGRRGFIPAMPFIGGGPETAAAYAASAAAGNGTPNAAVFRAMPVLQRVVWPLGHPAPNAAASPMQLQHAYRSVRDMRVWQNAAAAGRPNRSGHGDGAVENFAAKRVFGEGWRDMQLQFTPFSVPQVFRRSDRQSGQQAIRLSRLVREISVSAGRIARILQAGFPRGEQLMSRQAAYDLSTRNIPAIDRSAKPFLFPILQRQPGTAADFRAGSALSVPIRHTALRPVIGPGPDKADKTASNLPIRSAAYRFALRLFGIPGPRERGDSPNVAVEALYAPGGKAEAAGTVSPLKWRTGFMQLQQAPGTLAEIVGARRGWQTLLLLTKLRGRLEPVNGAAVSSVDMTGGSGRITELRFGESFRTNRMETDQPHITRILNRQWIRTVIQRQLRPAEKRTQGRGAGPRGEGAPALILTRILSVPDKHRATSMLAISGSGIGAAERLPVFASTYRLRQTLRPISQAPGLALASGDSPAARSAPVQGPTGPATAKRPAAAESFMQPHLLRPPSLEYRSRPRAAEHETESRSGSGTNTTQSEVKLQANVVQPPETPAIDFHKIVERVYKEIERKIRFDQQRRGR
ncbi:hypothetical protein [Paenibacillus hamazuiensis]|uniref:hypothetical protein n=1 Tax=Paenibacillus hamazuiensis TaxID=2936508 RepID=UPI0020105AFE|nr:hypothetical protein [Paenibacillus hamazuiensis]